MLFKYRLITLQKKIIIINVNRYLKLSSKLFVMFI